MSDPTEIARERVGELVLRWDWPDPALLDSIAALRIAAIPALQELLTPELLLAARTEANADALVYYGIVLLGALGTPAAVPVLVSLFGLVQGDLLEALPDAVQPLGPHGIMPLLGMVANLSLGYSARTLAGETAVNIAGTDLILRRQIADGLRPVLADYVYRAEPLTEEDEDFVASLVGSLADVADSLSRPLIERAFSDGKVNTEIISPIFVEELLQAGGRTEYRTPRPLLEHYRADYQAHKQEKVQP